MHVQLRTLQVLSVRDYTHLHNACTVGDTTCFRDYPVGESGHATDILTVHHPKEPTFPPIRNAEINFILYLFVFL